MIPTDCQSEVRAVFEKLTSWREESNRQISDIIISHSSSVSQGVNNLVTQVSNMEDELMNWEAVIPCRSG